MFQWLLASPVTGKVAPSTDTGVLGDNQDFGVEVTVCYAKIPFSGFQSNATLLHLITGLGRLSCIP